MNLSTEYWKKERELTRDVLWQLPFLFVIMKKFLYVILP